MDVSLWWLTKSKKKLTSHRAFPTHLHTTIYAVLGTGANFVCVLLLMSVDVIVRSTALEVSMFTETVSTL